MIKKTKGSNMLEKICPICGKSFIVTCDEYVYKIKGKYFCSWTCYRKYQKE